jgi:cytochrome c nitrite reductase small subunit
MTRLFNEKFVKLEWALSAETLVTIVAVMIGVFVGIGTFTFSYGDGAAYLSNDPQACANCHVMKEQFDSWQKSSHHGVATCNDCHTPHHPIGKWITKADNGFFHSLAFTLENFHEPIQIKPRNRRVTNSTCVDCHASTVHQMLLLDRNSDDISCVHCHSDVGHALRW